MKKAMLFIVALLFSVGASAATINIVNDVAGYNAVQSGFSPTVDPAGISYTVYDGDDIAGETDMEFYFGNSVTTDTTGYYKVEWTFNQQDDFIGGVISLGQDSTVSGFVWPKAITAAYSYVTYLIAGEAKFMDIMGLGNEGLNVTLTVGSVPVPAALFLFAPALLGFFGLRRRATLAA